VNEEDLAHWGVVAPKTNKLCVIKRDAMETHAGNGDLAQFILVC